MYCTYTCLLSTDREHICFDSYGNLKGKQYHEHTSMSSIKSDIIPFVSPYGFLKLWHRPPFSKDVAKLDHQNFLLLEFDHPINFPVGKLSTQCGSCHVCVGMIIEYARDYMEIFEMLSLNSDGGRDLIEPCRGFGRGDSKIHMYNTRLRTWRGLQQYFTM